MKLTELFAGAALDRAAPTRRSTAWAAVRAALESAGAPQAPFALGRRYTCTSTVGQPPSPLRFAGFWPTTPW
eukprot:10730405-Alexandrium_andersonii.AAC.1